MWLGSLAEFRFCNSPCQLYYVCRMDAEEDNQDFRSFPDFITFSRQHIAENENQ